MQLENLPWPALALTLACAAPSVPALTPASSVAPSSTKPAEPMLAPQTRTPEPASACAAAPTPDAAREVVDFWREAGKSRWFAKDPAFDRTFRERFASLYAAAAADELLAWAATPEGALGLILLLDQYPRNSFRGTARMYATDAMARERADAAIQAGHDRCVPPELAMFVYLPFGHSESLADQERSVELARRLGPPHLGHAEHHRNIVREFGRFPHRNAILGRLSSAAEQRYLANGGYQG